MNFPKPKIDRNTALEMWCETHSEYAKEQVILNNIGLVAMILKRLNQNVEDEDICSIGIMGLLKAINSFDRRKGFEFSSYASIAIRNQVLQQFRRKAPPCSVFA